MDPGAPFSSDRRPHLSLVRARAAVRPEGPLVLRDLGYVEGRRVHVVPAWGAAPAGGLEGLCARVLARRPETDTLVVPATGPCVLDWAGSLLETGAVLPRLLVARAASEAGAPARCVSTVDVSTSALEEAAGLLRHLAWCRFDEAAALALAGFWQAGPELGHDVVVVLADLEPLPPAAAA